MFENPSEGKIQLLVSPLVKLTNKVNAAIQDLGTPESILPRIGPYITGGLPAAYLLSAHDIGF